jgi:hypothetical protein
VNGGNFVTTDLEELAEWRAETDAHLARLDLVTEEHEQDLRAKRGADNKTLSAIRRPSSITARSST